MKNFLFFLLLSGLAALCSCTKSEPVPPSTQDTIIGQWNITSLIDIDGDELIDNTEPGFTTTLTLQFSADGTVNFELKYTELASGTTQVETASGTYTWQDDNTLRISTTTPDDPSAVTILTGDPVVTINSLSANFLTTSPDGDGPIVLKGERI